MASGQFRHVLDGYKVLDFTQFVAGPTVALSLVMGCLMITVMQYLMFSSVVKITSENFFAVMALAPAAAMPPGSPPPWR